MAQGSYKENHYVAQWYQRRFLPAVGEQKFRYLDLQPETFLDPQGNKRQKKSLQRWGTDRCFKQTDLYTTRFGHLESTEIEQFFFGRVDNEGKAAVEYFAAFTHPGVNSDAFHALLNYMSVQKLRTPKGLAQLAQMMKLCNKNHVLLAMQRYQNLHCAIWTEAVWAIVEAPDGGTQFIISDHPVTVYNQECFPASDVCRGFGDPEIWRNGTHTIFPLGPTKALLLTNLSWVRNPYGNAKHLRPHPNPLRPAMFKFTEIQTGRKLNEVEINQINFVIKKRAYRYVAAVTENWLYPERCIPSEHWRKLSDRYVLMPDPRSVSFSSEILIGYKGGRSEAFDEYGRRPWHKSYRDQELHKREWRTFHAFQGEYARLFGPGKRGICFEFGHETQEDSAEFHQYHLKLEKENLPRGLRPRRDCRAR
jgi:Protein of unknown function (DUF4238)